MKKPRGDSKLKTLPDALQEELWQYLRRNTNEKAILWLQSKHGLTTSPASLSEFFSWYPRQGWLKQAAQFSDSLEATVKKLPQLRVSAKQAAEIAQVNFELMAAQNRDAELFLALRKAEADTEKLRQADRRIKILEAKAAQADAAKKVLGDDSLTMEQRAAKMRGIFQM